MINFQLDKLVPAKRMWWQLTQGITQYGTYTGLWVGAGLLC